MVDISNMACYTLFMENTTTYRIPKFRVQLVRDGSEHAETNRVRTVRDVYNVVKGLCEFSDREMFIVLFLDTKNKITGINTVSVGDQNSTIVHPREVFKGAIIASAASIICVHNHPSGEVTPSPEDIAVTKRLAECGELLGIDLLDHVIIGDGRWTSLKEKGLF